MCEVYLLSHITILTTAFANNETGIALCTDTVFQIKSINVTTVVSKLRGNSCWSSRWKCSTIFSKTCELHKAQYRQIKMFKTRTRQ